MTSVLNTPEDRWSAGRAARVTLPRSAHAEHVATGRADPVALLEEQGVTRVQELLPIRYGRMLVSPFTFYRGAARIMAADLAAGPDTGMRVQLCGDAHLSNFGLFGSAERNLVFDLNDFDETSPGPFGWDVKRLATSVEIAGRDNGFTIADRAAAVEATVAEYCTAMNQFAAMKNLEVWYSRLDVDKQLGQVRENMKPSTEKRASKTIAAARAKDSMRAFDRLTEVVDGQRHIISDPPLVVPVSELLGRERSEDLRAELDALLNNYRATISPDHRVLLDQFHTVDLARKVVGVGSVGTRAWIILMLGRDGNDPLFLQAKEANESVLEGYAGKSTFGNHGERVVAGQRIMQATSDIFLGWERVPVANSQDGATHDYYIRQLADWKGSAKIERLSPSELGVYGAMCGWTLARAHARSGDRIAIAGYLGNGKPFIKAITAFAQCYADQNEQDYEALKQAAADGRIPVQEG